MAKSFYETIKGLVPASFIDHHESDLYVRDTPLVRAVVRQFGRESSSFKSKVDGHRWLDVPFAYEPFWTKKSSHAHVTAKTTSSALQQLKNYKAWVRFEDQLKRVRLRGRDRGRGGEVLCARTDLPSLSPSTDVIMGTQPSDVYPFPACTYHEFRSARRTVHLNVRKHQTSVI